MTMLLPPPALPPDTAACLAPMTIGGIVIDPPLTLAPMAGQTTHAFRRLAREVGGAGLVCTELLSSRAMHFRGRRASHYKRFDWMRAESPIAVQLYGDDPVLMAEAARLVVDHGADIVDINMGCWVPKVASKGGGAGLLRDVCTAAAVVEAVVKAVAVPVTVKVRSGWSADQITAIEFARAAEAAGVAAIAVHARTAEQGFRGEADWDIIRRVKDAVTRIPIIGNGDVTDAADAARMFGETGCDAVMIGRAALGQPWLFRQIAHELRTGEILPAPSRSERAALALQQARITVKHTIVPEVVAVRELRGQLTRYRLDEAGSRVIRNRLVGAETLADIEAVLLPLVEEGDPAWMPSSTLRC